MGGLSQEHVFGYGSLVLDGGRGVWARLLDHRRVWGVATDNVRGLPGAKMYLSRPDGARPAVYVAFLDVEPREGSTVGGVVRSVTPAELAELDRREGNYDRVEVTEHVEGFEGRVWAYVGSPEGRERLRRGRAEGRAVVSRDYLDRVRAGFRALGPEHERELADPALLDDLAVRDLDRVDLTPGAPRAEEGA